MKHISLGGLEVSRIGLGAMSMSGYYNTREGSDAESIRAIHRALDLGVTHLDTAEIYGPYLNEELVGRAIKGRRDQVVRSNDDLAADDWRKTNPRFVGENLRRNLRIVDEVAAVAAEAGATRSGAARVPRVADLDVPPGEAGLGLRGAGRPHGHGGRARHDGQQPLRAGGDRRVYDAGRGPRRPTGPPSLPPPGPHFLAAEPRGTPVGGPGRAGGLALRRLR
jgi:hypothetical protein